MVRNVIKSEISKLVPDVDVRVERQENFEHGDFSSNIALIAAKRERKNQKEFAQELKEKLDRSAPLKKIVGRIEIAGPGFLNFFLKKEFIQNSLPDVLKDDFGKGDIGRGTKVNVEFVSANPTGPLTMANGRGGFYGDALANVLATAGFDVTREYYINDAGNQVKLLGESIQASEGKIPWKEEYYQGEYIEQLKGKFPEEAVETIVGWLRESLRKARIQFDMWFSENENLRTNRELEKTLAFLREKNLIEERDGALWLNDAVVVKSDGNSTYFLTDLAYHYDKFIKRKFDIAIDIWGADHYGYVERMRKGVAVLGINPERLKIIIVQLVRLVSDGKEVRMSKRKGEFVTLDELIDSVGVDVARFFFLQHSPGTHMDFDLDLAKERSKKNPVFYIQYAHARACSILKKSQKSNLKNPYTAELSGYRQNEILKSVKLLEQPQELALIKKMLQFPELIEDIAQNYQVHHLTKYVYELAQSFTDFYENCRVLAPSEAEGIDEKNKKLTEARLVLVRAAKKVLEKTLGLMGIAAPEKM